MNHCIDYRYRSHKSIRRARLFENAGWAFAAIAVLIGMAYVFARFIGVIS